MLAIAEVKETPEPVPVITRYDAKEQPKIRRKEKLVPLLEPITPASQWTPKESL
jgi:hypothetical protein